MTVSIRTIAALAALLFGLTFTAVINAQPAKSAMASKEPGTVLVAIYHVAPGKHLDFLKWMAAREEVSKQAGVSAGQWYAHMDGDSWDYINIAPKTTDAQDSKMDEIAKQKGLTTGFKASLEFRTMIASHTDTYARGPTTATALVAAASE